MSAWHSDLEWLRVLHKTQYSNGLIGLHEQFTLFPAPATDTSAANLSQDELLLRRFRQRQRQLVETDMLIVANNHWNFDVRGFNPGGNHGSFLRISTHSTLMFAGGDRTGIPRGLPISEPYDSLSVVPTIMALIGDLRGREVELFQAGHAGQMGQTVVGDRRGGKIELRELQVPQLGQATVIDARRTQVQPPQAAEQEEGKWTVPS